jgi:DnaT-like ssDNA binding protein
MPIPTLDTTIGGASANSYVTLQNAEDYHDSRLNTEAWANATADNKTRALLMAANRLQSENWLGSRVTTTQRLAWPRMYVQKVDGIGPGYGWGYGYGWLFGDVYLTTEIPQRVKDAQCELALSLLEGFDTGGEDGIDSFTADGLSIKFSSRPAGGDPSQVDQLIAGLVAGNVVVRA